MTGAGQPHTTGQSDAPCRYCGGTGEHPACAHYRAVWAEWAADPTDRTLWARVNAALDGLEAHLR